MAIVYDTLIAASVLAFVPLFFILRSPWFWLTLAPAFFLLKGVYHTWGGRWRLPGQAEAGAVAGFIGMLLIPVALGVAFLGAAATGR